MAQDLKNLYAQIGQTVAILVNGITGLIDGTKPWRCSLESSSRSVKS